MSAYPNELFVLATRNRLAQMLTETYAKARNITLDESFNRLDTALRELDVIESLQAALFESLCDEAPDADPRAQIQKAQRTGGRRKKFKPAQVRRSDEGAWTALTVRIDMAAGFSGGEAAGLLDSEDGEALLRKGYALAGKFLAAQLLPR